MNIDLSAYDQSCKVDSDCMEITSGLICPTSCQCGGSVINVSGQAQYDQAIESIGSDGTSCPCDPGGVPRCVSGQCLLCGFGESQAGCPDGG